MNKPLLRRLLSPGIIFLLFAITLTAYHSTVSDLLSLWLNSSNVTYTHGSLLVVVSVFLFYRRWKQIRDELIITPEKAGLVLLLACSLFWFLAGLGNIAIVQQVMLIAILCLILWAILGLENMRRLMFPILLIICAIPVWEVINEGWLQKITATVVAEIMELVGYSVYLEGALIHLSAGTFKVAQNCSGMRQLVAAITIGFIYAYINDIKNYWAVVLVFLLALMSFFVNTLRIFIVVLAGQLTDMEHYFVREDHVTLGWILFAIAILIFIRSVDKYHVYFRQNKSKPVKIKLEQKTDSQIVPAIILTLLAVISGPVLAVLYGGSNANICTSLDIIPKPNGWKIQMDKYPAYTPAFIPADKEASSIFTNQTGSIVYSYVGYFASQHQERELISSLNKVADGDEWFQVSSSKLTAVINDEVTAVQENMIRSKRGNERLVWYWYYMSDKRTARPIVAKLYGIWDTLANNSGASVILISVDMIDSKDETREKLKLFVSQLATVLERAVDNVRCDSQ